MAHLPSFPDPSKKREGVGQKERFRAHNSQLSFSELTRLLGQHGAGATSQDLALDLVLHEIVSQACSATHAAGAAIALAQDDKFGCRATTGDHAPDLGSYLAAESGLSGACIQSREVQLCDDTETDPRVDAIACRRLGVRSLVVVPILKGGEVVGVLEVFSPRPFAFTDREAQTLLALSRRTIDTMEDPGEKEETVTSAILLDTETVPNPHKDPWIPVLTVLIVVLSVVLGWMIGHRGLWKVAKPDNVPQVAANSAKPVTPEQGVAFPVEAATPAANVPSSVLEKPKAPGIAPGGLMVYEKGKLVFQEKPVPVTARAIPVQVPPNAAESLILERVEPQYPRQARLARIQGRVVLEVNVDEKGSVQAIRILSGDPQLANAAAEAVRHWRFKPYAPMGRALSFQTQATVDFKLP
jgi:TonB family protein